MLVVMVFFIFEMVFTWIVEKTYRQSFFFFMDLAGTVSMIFEISFMLGESVDVDTVVLRTARTAKLGARVGRVFKIIKVLLKKPDKDEVSKANVMAQILTFKLSTKVSILTIALVMLVPLFSLPLYPYADLSQKLWAQRLEDTYKWQLDAAPTNFFEYSLKSIVT